MGTVKNAQFWQSKRFNNLNFNQYYNRLTELAISRFEWKNLPDTIDVRFMELVLFGDGMCVFFKDEVLGYLALRCMIGGILNVYQIPTERWAYAANNVNIPLNQDNSVIIFNNLVHTNSLVDVEIFSERLYKLDRIIDINTNAQKTPILITCSENERLTMKNLYSKYDGNIPVIYGDKNLNTKGVGAINTGAPYISDKIYALKTQYWNEALTYLGISNLSVNKKERLLAKEVTSNLGGTFASRYSALEARRQACKQINEMFGEKISVDYREEYEFKAEDMLNTEKGGEENE